MTCPTIFLKSGARIKLRSTLGQTVFHLYLLLRFSFRMNNLGIFTVLSILVCGVVGIIGIASLTITLFIILYDFVVKEIVLL